MDADELERYLDYYRDHVRSNPTNVEARLRLATIFREIDDRTRAVEHFEVAAELLADRELHREAIAACKAVLQIAPERRSAQYLLAHLYARTPDVFEISPRVAQPLPDEETDEPARPKRYRTNRDHLEDDTAVSRRPTSDERVGEPSREVAEAESEEELRETLDWSPEEQRERLAEYEEQLEEDGREPMSRDEMEDLLTTIDVEPSDIVDMEEIGDVEAFEEEYGSDTGGRR
jgi:tetratricopeptide (TPR) repeat protein